MQRDFGTETFLKFYPTATEIQGSSNQATQASDLPSTAHNLQNVGLHPSQWPNSFGHNSSLHATPADVVIHSSDDISFFAHVKTLLDASDNLFESLLPPSVHRRQGTLPSVTVPETSDVLNVILSSVYDYPCPHASFPILIAAVICAPRYGISLRRLIRPGRVLYMLLMGHAPGHAIELYTIAAQYELEELAVKVSSFLLNYPLDNMSNEMASTIPSKYLKRLYALKTTRIQTLKRLVLSPPRQHTILPDCGPKEYALLTKDWATAACLLVYSANADLDAITIGRIMGSAEKPVQCDPCRDALQRRRHELIEEWAQVKRTI